MRVPKLLRVLVPLLACVLGALVLIPSAHPQRSQPSQSPPPSPGEAPHQPEKLALRHPVERELGPGRSDVFTVKASAGQFLRVVVEKKGVDVVAEVEDPAGRKLIAADSPSRAFGAEPASLVAGQAGAYRIVVTESPRSAETGHYRIELTDLRRPAPTDPVRMQAEQELYAAALEERAQDKESRTRAIAGFQHAASLWHGLNDNYQEALCLLRIGLVYSALGDKEKALDYYNRALPLQRATGDRAGEAEILSDIGQAYSDLGERQKALDYFSQALPLRRAAGDRAGEASTLLRTGVAYWYLGEKQKALDYYNQALPLQRAVGDRAGEASTLVNTGNVYSDLGDKQKALDYYNQALPLKRAVGDRTGEAAALNNMGSIYSALGEKQKALEYYGQALPLHRASGNRRSEAITLNSIGNVYSALGEKEKALEYYNQALPLHHAVGNRSSEADTLANIGNVYSKLGEPQKALDSYNQALPLKRATRDRAGEAATLSNLGFEYAQLGEPQKALDCYDQALAIQRAVGQRASEAVTLNNMGEAYADLGQRPKALEQYLEALRLARAVSDPSLEGEVLNNLMRYWEAERNPALAIFFGKQAVNLHQQMRRNIQNLDQGLQRSYLGTVNEHYRHLADLLIAEGRLSEAEQVLSLLKGQEYLDYVRGDDESPLKGRADLTPEEAACEKRYLEIAGKLVGIGAERGDLAAKPSLTPAETGRLQQLEEDVAVGNMELERFLGEMARDFSAKPATALKVEELRETQGIMEDLRELPAGTVAIYTLVGEDKYRFILRTPDAQKAYEVPITGGPAQPQGAGVPPGGARSRTRSPGRWRGSCMTSSWDPWRRICGRPTPAP